MITSKLEEIRKDFKDLVSKIDTSRYSPYSKEFMAALFVGQMGVCMKMLMGDEEPGIMSDIEEEVEGMEKYIRDYESTQDMAYRQMAMDEHRHASTLIGKARTMLTDSESAKCLGMYEERLNEISRILS